MNAEDVTRHDRVLFTDRNIILAITALPILAGLGMLLVPEAAAAVAGSEGHGSSNLPYAFIFGPLLMGAVLLSQEGEGVPVHKPIKI